MIGERGSESTERRPTEAPASSPASRIRWFCCESTEPRIELMMLRRELAAALVVAVGAAAHRRLGALRLAGLGEGGEPNCVRSGRPARSAARGAAASPSPSPSSAAAAASPASSDSPRGPPPPTQTLLFILRRARVKALTESIDRRTADHASLEPWRS